MFCSVCFLWCIVFLVLHLAICQCTSYYFCGPNSPSYEFVNISQGVLDGKYDDLSEQAFYMVGGIEEVVAKAEKIAKENAD